MEIQIHPTEMCHGENDYEDVLQRLTSTISGNIGEGAYKTKIFSSACIYRVPKFLRKLKKSAYTPRLIAIGPLHRNEEHLQTPMKHVKMSYTDNLVCRLTVGRKGPELVEKKKRVLQECVAEMKKSLDDAKKCYAEDVRLDEEMLLVDGCFILEFLYRSRSIKHTKNTAEKKGKEPNDGGDNDNSKKLDNGYIEKERASIIERENPIQSYASHHSVKEKKNQRKVVKDYRKIYDNSNFMLSNAIQMDGGSKKKKVIQMAPEIFNGIGQDCIFISPKEPLSV